MKAPSNEQLVAYKRLHSKLTYQLKSAQTDQDHANAENALKRLKTDRDDMLQQFMADQSLSWIGNFHSRNESEVTSGSKAETEDLNKYQLRAALKLEQLDFDDLLLQSEMERVPSSPHPNKIWADADEKIYHYSRFKNIYSALDTSSVGEASHAAAKSTLEDDKDANTVNLQVKWDKLVTQKLKQCQKKVNKMGETVGTLMSFEAMCTILKADELLVIVTGANAEIKTKMQEWHLRMASVQASQQGHDTLKELLETIDENISTTNGIVNDVQAKLAVLDTAQKESSAPSKK